VVLIFRMLYYSTVLTGTRREGVYARLEESKAEITRKWGEYIRGEKQMPCSCQNQTQTQARRQAGDGAQLNGSTDMTKLEYVGEQMGPLTYLGKSTGTAYVFGTEPEHSVKYVYNEDIPALLTLSGFRYYDESSNEPVLEALGKPDNFGDAGSPHEGAVLASVSS
jgi:hypothetical protein